MPNKMFFTEQKLSQRIQEVKQYRYRDAVPITHWNVLEDESGLVNPKPPSDFSESHGMTIDDYWAGRDQYLWLNAETTIPAGWQGKKVLGLFDFGNTGGGNNSGFESLLYIEGKPYQGVDTNHQEVFLDSKHIGTDVTFTFRLWSGLEGGGVPQPQEHKIKQAQLVWLDEKVDDLYYLSLMICQTLDVLSDVDAQKHELKKCLEQAFQRIDWSKPGSDTHYQSLHQADEYLNTCIDSMDKNNAVTVTGIGHTHIDVAWLWRIKHTREKCARSFSTVMRLMELYPEYQFLQTQPQLYAYIKKDFPELYQQIKEKVQTGQWEADGAMWVEADCNLISGESLTRQILMGRQFLKQEFDKEPEYLWLPDVFGYSWALPQILRKSGIDMFMTTKISWNQYNRMPHDTFHWKGIDGSTVLAHFITTPGGWEGANEYFYTYNGELTPKTVQGSWKAYRDKDVNQNLLISYGYGDGGGGVNRDMLEQRRRIDRIPGLPHLKTGSAGQYFKELKDTVQDTTQYVHTWDGELYLEYHRGTYTSQAYNKKTNREMEYLYRQAEWMSVMAAILQGNVASAPQELLNLGWHMLLTEQFHDIIPGSSIREVYEDSRVTYGQVKQIADQVIDDSVKQMANGSKTGYTVLNTTSWNQDSYVAIEGESQYQFIQKDGQLCPTQNYDGKTYVLLQEVPAMGYTRLHESAHIQHDLPIFHVQDRKLDTLYYLVEFNSYGQISRLYDKQFQREVLIEGQAANVFQMFEDKPLAHDAWDIDIFYQEKMNEIRNLSSFEVVSHGSLFLKLLLSWDYMDSKIEQCITFYHDSRRIDFETFVDFHEHNQLMKVAFPVDIRATYATYDIQYGNVRRANHWNTSWDYARFESVAHKWADLSEQDYGVALLNNCKYGYDIKDNVIRMSLIKSAVHPDYTQDQGEHHFTYSLFPHAGDFVAAKVEQEAAILNQPLQAISGSLRVPYESFVKLNHDHLSMDAIKRSEDGRYIVLRFHEYAGGRVNTRLDFGFEVAAWASSDLMERPIGVFTAGAVEVSLKPYEIMTLLLKVG